MARIRTIKPGFFRHEELYLLEKATALPMRISFAGLWTVADREGRFKWRPKEIKLDVLPFDEVDMEDVLDKLFEAGFILKYCVDGKYYGYIPSFLEHQVINAREAKSTLPVITQQCMCMHVHAHGEGKGREEEGKGIQAHVIYVPTDEPKIEATLPLPPVPLEPPIDEDEPFISKSEAFEYLKGNYLVIEETRKTISGKGWPAIDEVHVVGLIKMFVNAKAKIEDPPKEIRQHFRNWIFREPIKNLTEIAETFKRQLSA
jgi:hypothetical protein